MPESNNHDSTSPASQVSKRSSWPLNFLLFSILGPVVAALLLYQLDSFDPAPLPLHELSQLRVAAAPTRNAHMLKGSEFLGVGALAGPEDVAYDSKSGLIYTGCADGWVKRVTVNESANDSVVVENWVNTGGRPLGLAHGHNGDLLVADAEKGLLRISQDGAVEVMTDEAEGVKFKLTDCVDVAKDGMIYFTDASYKYSLKDFIWDFLEGRPHGRLLSYDPTTKETKVLARDLYFANGVALSLDQNYLIFCETFMRRCRKYYLQGEKKGSIPTKSKNSGVMAVNLEGEPTAHYSDPGLSHITSGIKIGNYLYCGSIRYPYIIRLDLEQHPAHAST